MSDSYRVKPLPALPLRIVKSPSKMYIYLRLPVYVFTILVHITNSIYMTLCFQGEVMKNRNVKHFHDMSLYFFTCWNFAVISGIKMALKGISLVTRADGVMILLKFFKQPTMPLAWMFQTTYAMLSLYCDITTSKRPGFKHPKWLTDGRNAFYSILVWPSTMIVVIIFWTMYFYDRSMIYPTDIDLVISSTSNHIVHIYIVPIGLWETIYRPRIPPENHKWYVLAVVGVEVIYFSTVLGVYMLKGVWVYPFFGLLDNNLSFFAFTALIAALLVILYHVQWIFNGFVWGPRFYEDIGVTEKLSGTEIRLKNDIKKVTEKFL